MDKNRVKKDKEKDENAEYRKEYNAAVTQRMKDEKVRQKALASQRLQVMYQEKSALLQEMQRLKAQLRKTERDNNIIRRQSVEQATIIAKKSSLAKSVMDEMLRLNIEAKTRACLWCLRCQWQKKVFAAFGRWWCNVIEMRTIYRLKDKIEDKWRTRVAKAKLDQKNSSIAEKASWKAAQSAKRMVERLMIHSRSKKHVVRSNVKGDKAFSGSPSTDQEGRRNNLLNQAQRFLGAHGTNGTSNMNSSTTATTLRGGDPWGRNTGPHSSNSSMYISPSQSSSAQPQLQLQSGGITLGDKAISSTDYFALMEKKKDYIGNININSHASVEETNVDDGNNDCNDEGSPSTYKAEKSTHNRSPSMSDALVSLALEELGDIGELSEDDKKALKDILTFSPISSTRLLNDLPLQDNNYDINIDINASKHYLNDTVDGDVDGNSYTFGTTYAIKGNNAGGNGGILDFGLDTKTPTTVTEVPSYMQPTVSARLSEARRYNKNVFPTTTIDNTSSNVADKSHIKMDTSMQYSKNNDYLYFKTDEDATQDESMSRVNTSMTTTTTVNDEVDNKYKIPKFASGKTSKSSSPSTKSKSEMMRPNSSLPRQTRQMYRAQRELIDGSHKSYILENSSTIRSTTFKARQQVANHTTPFR